MGALKREMQALDAQVAEAERMLKLADPEVRWLSRGSQHPAPRRICLVS